MDCTAPADAAEYMSCSAEIIQPIMDVIVPVLGISVTLAMIFVGVRFAKSVVKEFGKT